MTKTTTQPIRDLVRDRCDAKGWTFAGAAEHAGISLPALKKLCAGLVACPQSPTVRGLAKMLGISTFDVRAAIQTSRKQRGVLHPVA